MHILLSDHGTLRKVRFSRPSLVTMLAGHVEAITRNQPLIFLKLSLFTMLGMFLARTLGDSILVAVLAYFLPCMLWSRYSDGFYIRALIDKEWSFADTAENNRHVADALGIELSAGENGAE
ncbi:hypothetical protein [Aquitalea sp. ASV15]|uniref:hypothetical protein n=1 Tax=Aquitalea sp. ASV15 TaxID=2795104 RepID=UPI0018ECC222|nr:hypothetical protein [Aquitalea sp. ASV15]